jgi:hypothetical protein
LLAFLLNWRKLTLNITNHKTCIASDGDSLHTSQKFLCAKKRVVQAMAWRIYWKGLTQVEYFRPTFKEYDRLPVFSLYTLNECSKFERKNPEKCVKEKFVPEQATYDTRNGQKNEKKLYAVPKVNVKIEVDWLIILGLQI